MTPRSGCLATCIAIAKTVHQSESGWRGTGAAVAAASLPRQEEHAAAPPFSLGVLISQPGPGRSKRVGRRAKSLFVFTRAHAALWNAEEGRTDLQSQVWGFDHLPSR